MNTEVIIAIITSSCSLIGVILTVIFGNKQTQKNLKEHADLTIYRIEQLEKKQDKHNTLIERMYKIEDRASVIEERLKVANHRIEDLENK